MSVSEEARKERKRVVRATEENIGSASGARGIANGARKIANGARKIANGARKIANEACERNTDLDSETRSV